MLLNLPKTLIFVLITLQILDAISSRYASTLGWTEMNPYLLKITGETNIYLSLLIVKVFLIAILILRIMKLEDYSNKLLTLTCALDGVAILYYVYVVLNNFGFRSVDRLGI